MNEQAETHTLLNRPDEALPSPDDGSHDLQEHALSLDAALKSAGSDFLPQMESSHISKKFLDVENERKEQFQPAPENSARPASTAPASTPQSTTGSLIDYDHLISSSEPVQQQQQPSPPTTPMAMPMTTAAPSSQKAQTLQFPPQPSEAGVVQGSRAAWRVETEVEAAVARERDVAAAFSGLPRVRATWKHNYMKILLVGDDGLGKTTFVRNLFAAYAADVNFPVADATGEGSAAVFGEHPERLCTQLSVKDEDEMVYWHYLVQASCFLFSLSTSFSLSTTKGQQIYAVNFSFFIFFSTEKSHFVRFLTDVVVVFRRILLAMVTSMAMKMQKFSAAPF